MDISGLPATVMNTLVQGHTGNGDQVSVKLINKAEEIQENTAMTLIESLPDTDSRVGQNIDVKV